MSSNAAEDANKKGVSKVAAKGASTTTVVGSDTDKQDHKLSEKQCREFASTVLEWFEVHGRKHLPWQQNPTPYRVWVSEIMLQQTQVTTVIPYFERFMQRYEHVGALAAASQDDVLSLWTGLGYYARGRNLHKAAQLIVQDHHGELPPDLDSLVKLPGIGRSTAGAILSLGFGQSAPILDGNVKRVLCRYCCVDGWPGQTAVERRLWDLTTAVTPIKHTAKFNQAMMDLGATLCTRTRPACERCPLNQQCLARQSGVATKWPHKKPKKDKPTRQTLMLLAINDDGSVLLQRRPSSGLWGGLWSFPQFDDLDSLQEYATTLGRYRPTDVEQWDHVQHSFTHFDLRITPVRIALKLTARDRIMDASEGCWVDGELPGGCAAPVKRLLDKLTHTLL